MPWLKFHQDTMIAKETPVLINTDLVYKAEPWDSRTKLSFTAPNKDSHAYLVVNESFAEVVVMLDAENADD